MCCANRGLCEIHFTPILTTWDRLILIFNSGNSAVNGTEVGGNLAHGTQTEIKHDHWQTKQMKEDHE